MSAATDFLELEILDHILRVGSYTMPSGLFVQLHTADPTDAGTTAVASNNTRTSVTFGAASAGTSANTTAVTWASVPASETYSHFTIWDASTSGNPLIRGALTAPQAVVTGNTFTIPIGSLTVSLA